MTRPPRLFRFRSHASDLDLARLVDTDPILRRLRQQAADHFVRAEKAAGRTLAAGRGEARAVALVEDMLEAAFHGVGEHFVAGKIAVINRIVDARIELVSMFDTIMQGGRIDIAPHLKKLESIYRDLDNDLIELRKAVNKDPPPQAVKDDIAGRLAKEVRDTEPNKPRQKLLPADANALRERSSGRTRLQRHGYRKKPGLDTYSKTFEGGERIELTIKEGKFHAETFDASGRPTAKFSEHDTLPTAYRNAPLTGSIFQAHHGLETDLMSNLFGSLYDANAVPTIWLRDNKGTSPHGIATGLGNSLRSTRRVGLTYAKIRGYAVADLLAGGVPPTAIATYLAAIDSHVRLNIVPKLRSQGRMHLLGGWQ